MSRIYRALQLGSRTLPESDGKPGSNGADPLAGINIVPDPVEFGESLEASGTTDRTHEDNKNMSKQTLVVEPEPPRDEIPRNGMPGIQAKGLLDSAAPFIPNATDPAVIESYGRLRAKIVGDQERDPFRSLVITSPAPGDGKSVTAINLALSLAALPSYRVLLVDGDLRRGRLGKALGVGNPPGLGNLIEGSAELEDVVLKCDDNPVYFMARGSSEMAPGELLYSSRLVPQLRKMAEHFSLVLIDSPPINLVADAQRLAAGCDAVLLVARAFSTTRKGLQKAVQDLSSFRVIGTVLNRGMRTDLYRHYRYY